MRKKKKPKPIANAAREPRQDRSRETVRRILDAAAALFTTIGGASVTMSKVARQAKVPNASVYRYFPTKGSLIRHLMQETIDAWELRMRAHLDSARNAEELAKALHVAFWEIYRESAAQSVMHDVWAAVLVDRSVNKVLVENNERWTNMYFTAARRFVTHLDDHALKLRLRLLGEMWDSAVRLAVLSPPEEADAIMLEAARIYLSELGLPTQCLSKLPAGIR
jgi:AcrR family transcriptional regulator